MREYIDVIANCEILQDGPLIHWTLERYEPVVLVGLDSQRLCVLLAKRLAERNREIQVLEARLKP